MDRLRALRRTIGRPNRDRVTEEMFHRDQLERVLISHGVLNAADLGPVMDQLRTAGGAVGRPKLVLRVAKYLNAML